MKKKMSWIALVSVMTLMASLLAACGGSGGIGASKEPDGNASGAATTLRFATWDTGDALKIEQEIAKKFEESHPGTKVQVESYADGFDQKRAAGFGAANPPDVMYMWDFPTYHQSR
ncbi:extracellular solute-binding protein, partial [Clostridium perfringens]